VTVLILLCLLSTRHVMFVEDVSVRAGVSAWLVMTESVIAFSSAAVGSL